MGPLGLLSPHPGVSYLFTGENPASLMYPGGVNGAQGHPSNNPNYHSSNPNLHQYSGSISGMSENEVGGSLWGIANASSTPSGGFTMGNGMVSLPVAAWTSSLGEMVLKIDSKLKVCVFPFLQILWY